jgi:hypothetical protein
MTKKVDWESTYKPFGTQTVSGAQPKYKSGKEYFQKAIEEQKIAEEIEANFQKALPALEALLKCRLESGTPLTIMRPLVYTASELVHQYEQTWDDKRGEFVNGESRGAQFQDVQKALQPGTELVLKSLDPNMSEFLFTDQKGNEIALPYMAKMELMTKTNIYESVIAFMNKRGD